MWWDWRTRQISPNAGGWLDQPLDLLAKFQAYETTYNAYTSNEKRDGVALDKLDAIQSDIVMWLESESDPNNEQH
jgi:hypothetical protein